MDDFRVIVEDAEIIIFKNMQLLRATLNHGHVYKDHVLYILNKAGLRRTHVILHQTIYTNFILINTAKAWNMFSSTLNANK